MNHPQADSSSLPVSEAGHGDERERFLAAIRHELRTPMNHIIGYCEMLIEDADDIGYAHMLADLQKIHGAGKNMLALVNDFFDPLKEGNAEHQLSQIRHDLRTSVNHIIGYSEILLEEEQGLDEERLGDLARIRTAARQLLDLINDTARLAKADSVAVVKGADLSGVSGAVLPARSESHAGHLLVVDDNAENRDMLSRRLRRLGYTVMAAENGLHALDMLARESFDLVLLDVMMPELDGHATLERMKRSESLRHIPVLMISALDEISSITRAIEMGAEDYLPKPFDPVLLRARIGASLEKKRLRDQEQFYRRRIEEYNLHLEDKVREQVGTITLAQMATIFALSKLAESRDPETGAHLERIREYCKALAISLSKRDKYARLIDQEYVDNLYIASPLHDIGKVGIPDHVLLKPGKLTDAEFVIMKNHTLLGARTLLEVSQKHIGNSFIQIGIEIAESHHEKWDGSGYPYGLSGDSIPLSGRILALADVYDALRSRRCYKEPFSHEKSRGIILSSRGTHFDPEVVDCFLEQECEFESIWAQLNHNDE